MKRGALALVAISMLAVVTSCSADNEMFPDPKIKTAALPPGTVGTLYDFTLEADPEGNKWTIEEGSLPPRLFLFETIEHEWKIWGTPAIAGTFPLRVCNRWDVFDVDKRDCVDLTLTINPAPKSAH